MKSIGLRNATDFARNGSIGLLGEYVERIYEEVRQRPRFIIERSEGVEYDPGKV